MDMTGPAGKALWRSGELAYSSLKHNAGVLRYQKAPRYRSNSRASLGGTPLQLYCRYLSFPYAQELLPGPARLHTILVKYCDRPSAIYVSRLCYIEASERYLSRSFAGHFNCPSTMASGYDRALSGWYKKHSPNQLLLTFGSF